MNWLKEFIGVLFIIYLTTALIMPVLIIIYVVYKFNIIQPLHMLGFIIIPFINYPLIKGTVNIMKNDF